MFAPGARATYALLVVTPQLIAHRDAHRLLHELERGTAVILGGIENMAGQVCPSCGELTELFPAAAADEAIWARVPRLARVPFSAAAARDADRGLPVMVTGAVPQQVAAYQLVARQVRDAVAGGPAGPDGSPGPA